MSELDAVVARERQRSPELDVLLGLIAGTLGEGPAVDAEAFVALARAHKLVPFVSRRLRELTTSRVPAAARERLVNEARTDALRSLNMTHRLVTVLAELERRGVPCRVLKGPVLALQAFGDLGARSYVDLDVLVLPADASVTLDALTDLGFVPTEDEPAWQGAERLRLFGERTLVHQGWRVAVDLHTHAVEPGYSFSPPDELLFAASNDVTIGGRAVAALSPALTIAYHCYHSTKHSWGALGYVAELAALLRNPDVDEGALEQLAGYLGSRRMLGLGLLLASRVGGVTLSPPLAALAADAPERAAAIAASRWSDPQPHWLPWIRSRSLRSPLERDEVYWRAFDRRRDLARLVSRVLLVPTPKDWAVMRLPRRLRALYTPVRLARLALRELGWQPR